MKKTLLGLTVFALLLLVPATQAAPRWAVRVASDDEVTTVSPSVSPSVSPAISPFVNGREIEERVKQFNQQQREDVKKFQEDMKEQTQSFRRSLFDEIKDTVKQRLDKIRVTAHLNGTIKVVGTNGLTVTVENTDYTVNITDKTQLRRRFWGSATLSEFQNGDKVNVIGAWTDQNKTTVNATLIRDLSIEKRWGVFMGDVKSVSSNGLVFASKGRGDLTVTTTSTTKIVARNEKPIPLSEIKAGDRVRVKGVWDLNSKQITSVDQIKDFSNPVRTKTEEENEKSEVKPSVTPSVTPTTVPTVSVTPTPTT